jgi:hypothetical protein
MSELVWITVRHMRWLARAKVRQECQNVKASVQQRKAGLLLATMKRVLLLH